LVVERRRAPKPKTYFRISEKGERNIKRDARKRGQKASTTGFKKE